MHFSSGIKLAGLDDYLKPSQECIKPVKINRLDRKEAIHLIEEEGTYHEVLPNGSKVRLEKTKISLTDCLACSGCVTSAEAVLVEEQGLPELYRQLATDKTLVVTLSQQSTASVAGYFGITFDEAFEKLSSFFYAFGVRHVFDISVARDFSMLESAKEFIDRKRRAMTGDSSAYLPMICGACPGWVCYAEKTQSDFILPYISTTKSPQQIMGSLVKGPFAESISTHPLNILHVCVMPCFDKKLEASRVDFRNEEYPDVDLVISSLELLEMIREHTAPDTTAYNPNPAGNIGLPTSSNFTAERGNNYTTLITPDNIKENKKILSRFSFLQLQQTRTDSCLSKSTRPFSENARTSGGYLEYIFRVSSKEIFGQEVMEVIYKKGRNEDRLDADLILEDKTVLKFGIVYGFRNIQNIVRQIKSKKCNYDFLEVMACPGGCTNGGGQIRAAQASSSSNLLQAVNAAFFQTKHATPEENPTIQELYQRWLPTPELQKLILHTTYHNIPPLEISHPLSIKW